MCRRMYHQYCIFLSVNSWTGPLPILLDQEGIPGKFFVSNNFLENQKNKWSNFRPIIRPECVFEKQSPKKRVNCWNKVLFPQHLVPNARPDLNALTLISTVFFGTSLRIASSSDSGFRGMDPDAAPSITIFWESGLPTSAAILSASSRQSGFFFSPAIISSSVGATIFCV